MSDQQMLTVDKSKHPSKLRIRPLPSYPDVLLALNVLDTNPPRFHWYLFVPNELPSTAGPHLDLQPGLKMHATTDYSPSADERLWSFDATPITLATDEGGLAAAAIIGRLDPRQGRSKAALRDMLAQIQMMVPEVDREREAAFTCRVWVREALRRMHAEGYVWCPDVNALEEEMWRYGREAAKAIEDDTFVIATLETAVASRAVQPHSY